MSWKSRAAAPPKPTLRVAGLSGCELGMWPWAASWPSSRGRASVGRRCREVRFVSGYSRGHGQGLGNIKNIYKYMVRPPQRSTIFCVLSLVTSQNLQGLGRLASQLHLASAFWLHRMNMLKKPEEIKNKQKNQGPGRMPRSESRKVNKPRRNFKKIKVLEQNAQTQ